MQIYQLENPLTLQQHLAETFLIYQLIEDLDGETHWQPVDDGDEAPLSERPPISPPKKFLFAEQQNLFVFDGETFRETLPAPEPFALLGVHSCDLTAIAYQDQFFAEDPYYQARRQQALLIGIDCITPCRHGFCPTVDAGPGVRQNCADLILHRHQQNQWLLIVCSEKGEQALAGLNLQPAAADAAQQRQQALEHCEQQFTDHRYIQEGIRVLNDKPLPEQFWQPLGIQCLSCSGCTVLCPTCSCYGTRDMVDADDNIVKQRFWDSCLFESFQREASQHNPGEEPGQRVQRFWTHKFSNDYLPEFGRYGCVGCGRCEQTCPGTIGVHSVMTRIADHV